MAAISKFAVTETKTLMKVHASNLFQWAQNNNEFLFDHTIKEALLATISRLYELVEELPEATRMKH
jgi:hypothetical protein